MTEATIYFWNVDGSSYESLSQWYRCAFADAAGTSYTSTEMYMMYQKAMLFGDTDTAARVLTAKEPAEQKKLGRLVRNFDSKIWNQHKLAIVTQGNLLKFGQAYSTNGKVRLRNVLLETGNSLLVEASPEDRVWGIGYSEVDAPTVARSVWGENLLGTALMNVRVTLKELNDTQT